MISPLSLVHKPVLMMFRPQLLPVSDTRLIPQMLYLTISHYISIASPLYPHSIFIFAGFYAPNKGRFFGPGTKLDLDDALDGLAEVATVHGLVGTSRKPSILP